MSDRIISIIIPVHNSDRYLVETLNSILAQEYQKWECIIVDDGSTDGSNNIAKGFVSQDNRFSYHYQDNAGPSSARNAGLALSNGEYIQFLDADDVLAPNRFTELIPLYVNASQNIVLYSSMTIGNHQDIQKLTSPSRKSGSTTDLDFDGMYRQFGLEVLFVPGCVLFSRKSLQNVEWNEQLNHSEDWDLYLQVTANGFLFRHVNKALTIYRDSPEGLSKNIENTAKANYIILKKWFDDENRFWYVKRCAHQFSRHILLYLRGKLNKLVLPMFNTEERKNSTLSIRLLVYGFTLGYVIRTLGFSVLGRK